LQPKYNCFGLLKNHIANHFVDGTKMKDMDRCDVFAMMGMAIHIGFKKETMSSIRLQTARSLLSNMPLGKSVFKS
jgi:hypothetical protein